MVHDDIPVSVILGCFLILIAIAVYEFIRLDWRERT